MNIYERRDDPVTADVVSTLSLVRTNWRHSRIRQLVAVDIVAKVEQFNSVDFVEFDKIDRVEFDFVACVYRAITGRSSGYSRSNHR